MTKKRPTQKRKPSKIIKSKKAKPKVDTSKVTYNSQPLFDGSTQ